MPKPTKPPAHRTQAKINYWTLPAPLTWPAVRRHGFGALSMLAKSNPYRIKAALDSVE